MGRYANDSLLINTTDEVSAIKVAGVTDIREDLNSTILSPDTAQIYDTLASIALQAPEIQFTTTTLALMLDKVPLYGACIQSDGTHPGVIGYNVSKSQCATHGRAASNHRSATIAWGHMFLGTLSAQRNQDATIQTRIHATTDSAGTVEPVIVAYDATLPTSPTLTHYSLGKPDVCGEQIAKILSVTINFNPQFQKPNECDSIWPKEVDIEKVRAVIQMTSEDPSILAAAKIPNVGKAATHVNSKLRFIKRAHKGKFADFGTEVHITGTFDGYATVRSPYGASGARSGVTTIEIALMDDGTDEPIVWDTTATYSLS